MSEPCGAFSYELLDADTGLPLSPAIFIINNSQGPQPFVIGTIPSRVPYVDESPIRL